MTAAPQQTEQTAQSERAAFTTSIRWSLAELARWTVEERLAYVVRLVRELQRRQGRAGEPELHQLAYVLQHMAGVPTGYAFALGSAGAHAPALDGDLSELEAVGWLEAGLDRPGAGMRARPTPAAERLLKAHGAASVQYTRQIATAAQLLRNAPPPRLELLPTAHFLWEAGPALERAALLAQMQALKPHYDAVTLAAAFEDWDHVRRQLAAPEGQNGR